MCVVYSETPVIYNILKTQNTFIILLSLLAILTS